MLMPRGEGKRVCNIVFYGLPPLEVLLYASINNCSKRSRLPYMVRVKVYYSPGCPACRRFFLYAIDTDNLFVEAYPVEDPKIAARVEELVGKVVTPIAELENGAVIRGCPPSYEEFIERLKAAYEGRPAKGIVRLPGSRRVEESKRESGLEELLLVLLRKRLEVKED